MPDLERHHSGHRRGAVTRGSISPSYGDNALDKRNLSEDEIAATNAADEACQNETQYKNIVDLYLSLKENPRTSIPTNSRASRTTRHWPA